MSERATRFKGVFNACVDNDDTMTHACIDNDDNNEVCWQFRMLTMTTDNACIQDDKDNK